MERQRELSELERSVVVGGTWDNPFLKLTGHLKLPDLLYLEYETEGITAKCRQLTDITIGVWFGLSAVVCQRHWLKSNPRSLQEISDTYFVDQTKRFL